MTISMGRVRAFSASALLCSCGMSVCAQTLFFTEVSDQTGIVVNQETPVDMPMRLVMAGGAVGDFNSDGWQDLFVLSGGVEPDHLFINNGDGTFTDRAAEWGVALAHFGVAATCADFNGDGWMDISVSSMGPSAGLPSAGQNMLYRNNGDGTFTDVAVSAGVAMRVQAPDSFATAFGDYDNDGDLDMFSTAYTLAHQGNRLWRNNGDETFTDVTAIAGLDAMIPESASGYVPSFIDLDMDGALDIILIGDHGTSMVFKGNSSGTFSNFTSSVSRLNTANGMGLAIGDLNGDGRLDFYISSIYFSFLQTSGNLLFIQQANGTFQERARLSGVNQCGYSWGVLMVDLDHDGLEDLVATKNADGTPTQIFKDLGGVQFVDISGPCGFNHFDGGRGLVNFDYDNDGDEDIVVFTNNGRIGVWRNDLFGDDINSLRVNLDTSARPTLAPEGYHSVVRLSHGGATHMQVIDGATNHCSSGEHGAHFGLGADTAADWVRVEWRDGTSTTVADVAANQVLTVRAPFHPGDFNGDDLLDLSDITDFVAAFNARSPSADLNGDGLHSLNDLSTFVRWYLGL
ncbi:MAG: CRTAC1 family protein [Phycisphaeraceae bacterium]|nr:MAG: CRTAC1 family protein [Phycisphaeraceae bacterium]